VFVIWTAIFFPDANPPVNVNSTQAQQAAASFQPETDVGVNPIA
jgi:hypothetical protein